MHTANTAVHVVNALRCN